MEQAHAKKSHCPASPFYHSEVQWSFRIWCCILTSTR